MKKNLYPLLILPCISTVMADSLMLEEIVVTAQKREQPANEVAIAITTYSGAQMEALGLENSTDMIAFTPGVSLAGDIGGQRAIFNIRGIVQNDYGDLAEAPVAVYVDGGYLASTQAQTFGLYDIDRVEILKGPQGTLFGRNATGGLVNTITNKPTGEAEGYLEATVATFEQIRFEGAMGGPLADGVRGRFSFLYNQQDEILENVYDGTDPAGIPGTVGGGGDGYNDDTLSARVQLEWDVGSEGHILLSANWADTTKSEGPYQHRASTEIHDASGNVIDVIFASNDPNNCDIILAAGGCADGVFDGDDLVTRPTPGGDMNGNNDPDGSGNKVNKDFAFDDQNQIESEGLSLEFQYDLGWSTLYALSDYKNFTRLVGLDSDQSATPVYVFQSDGDIEQLSQEIRFNGSNDSVKWVAGLYYLGIETDWIQGLAAPSTSVVTGDAGLEFNTITNTDTDSYSVFGQVDISLSERLVLVGGVRFIQEDKAFEGVVTGFVNSDDRAVELSTPLFDITSASLTNDQDLWSGKLQLEFTSDDDSLYYIGINRGVKAGSFNAPLFCCFSTYDPEELLSYEGGAKLTLMDGMAQLNASVYYYDYEGYQSFSWVNNSGVVTNEDATYVGGEIELVMSPTDSMEVLLGISYSDATVEDLEVAAGIFKDTAPPFTPDVQVSGMVRYSWNALGGNLSAMASASYQSEVFHNARNYTAHEFDAYTVFDLRLIWEDEKEEWTVIGFADNLADDDHEAIGFDLSGFYGATQVSYAKPRTVGLTVRRNF